MSRLVCIVLLVSIATQTTLSAKDDATCPVVKMEAVRLPDLNVPRVGHSVFVVNGEPTVVGGHTTSFVPTATAEYFRDGQWHLVPTAYPHDQGFSVPLSSGKVLIGGGHAEPLGIGHIYSVEMYDPASHTFKGFGCLDTKRCFASCTEIDSGRVVISGNWYQNIDDIEVFDGHKYFHSIKKTAQRRSRPLVLRIAEDDVIVFSLTDEHGDLYDTIVVDRLKGEPFLVPLFDEWKPLTSLVETDSRGYLASDGQQNPYTYLIPVINEEGQVAICRIAGTQFSLLPTNGPIPMTCKGRHINYQAWLCTDQQAGRAYLYGVGDNDGRLYVLTIDIAKVPADLTLLYTEPTGHPVYGYPVLMPDGNLLLTGGMECNPDTTVDNFTPHATVLLLPVSSQTSMAGSQKNALMWIVPTLLAALAAMCFCFIYYRKRRSHKPSTEPESLQESQEEAPASNLLLRLYALMDEEKPYLTSTLNIQDVADLLGTNRTYISNCLKKELNQSFPQFIKTYRVDYAKQLLTRHPDKKILAVATEAGFANESSFFRAFKEITGITPNEWKASYQ